MNHHKNAFSARQTGSLSPIARETLNEKARAEKKGESRGSGGAGTRGNKKEAKLAGRIGSKTRPCTRRKSLAI